MLSTRLLMSAASLFTGVLGVAFTFAPEELLRFAGIESAGLLPLMVQVLGALYLGYAMLDWMARDSALGGIYGRPIVIANLVHFTAAALALVKGAVAIASPGVFALTLAYAVFAVLFGLTMFTTPRSVAGGSEAG